MASISKYVPGTDEWEQKPIHPEVAESCLSVMTKDKRDMSLHVCQAIVRDLRSEYDEAHFVRSLGYPKDRPVHAIGVICVSPEQNVRVALDSELSVQEFMRVVPNCVDIREKSKARR